MAGAVAGWEPDAAFRLRWQGEGMARESRSAQLRPEAVFSLTHGQSRQTDLLGEAVFECLSDGLHLVNGTGVYAAGEVVVARTDTQLPSSCSLTPRHWGQVMIGIGVPPRSGRAQDYQRQIWRYRRQKGR